MNNDLDDSKAKKVIFFSESIGLLPLYHYSIQTGQRVPFRIPRISIGNGAK
ncbi:MAG: hypothetical protein IPG01_18035 [Chitinophagaceae bacterium]|nr:hypothetical protein [Chitinophagaceae bacterium]MBK6484978.1 hypothetical protein [Chitinophagaceae bacterium]